jgi:hypothetical protein
LGMARKVSHATSRFVCGYDERLSRQRHNASAALRS